MTLPGNGKTRAAIVSAVCAILVCGGVVGGWYTGWKAQVSRTAVREQAISDHLLAADRGFARLSEVEMRAAATANKVDNMDANVRMLIESQERTNDKLERLSETLMEYLAAQARRPGDHP